MRKNWESGRVLLRYHVKWKYGFRCRIRALDWLVGTLEEFPEIRVTWKSLKIPRTRNISRCILRKIPKNPKIHGKHSCGIPKKLEEDPARFTLVKIEEKETYSIIPEKIVGMPRLNSVSENPGNLENPAQAFKNPREFSEWTRSRILWNTMQEFEPIETKNPPDQWHKSSPNGA